MQILRIFRPLQIAGTSDPSPKPTLATKSLPRFLGALVGSQGGKETWIDFHRVYLAVQLNCLCLAHQGVQLYNYW